MSFSEDIDTPYFGPIPDVDEVVETIAELEQRINRVTTSHESIGV